MSCLNFGFTLAEVLITLGIIGVVAAMTLPTVVNKYQKNVATGKLKKIYSVLTNATLRAENDYGPSEYWDYPITSVEDGSLLQGIDVNGFYNRYYAPYLNMSENVKNTMGEYTVTNLNGNDANLIGVGHTKNLYRINSVEGICIKFWSNNQYVAVMVDLNCASPPNVLGKDVFDIAELYWERQKNLAIPRLLIIKDAETRAEALELCKSFTYGNGVPNPCFAVFVYDGWQFKDDYPW